MAARCRRGALTGALTHRLHGAGTSILCPGVARMICPTPAKKEGAAATIASRRHTRKLDAAMADMDPSITAENLI